jgi:hypothetical protein
MFIKNSYPKPQIVTFWFSKMAKEKKLQNPLWHYVLNGFKSNFC